MKSLPSVKSVNFLVANEFNLPWAVLRAIAGQDVCLLDVRSLLPGCGSLLRWVIKLCCQRGLLSVAKERFPRVRPMLDIDHYCNMTDMFLRVEPWVEHYFDFARADRINDSYTMLYKHTCWGEVYQEANLAHVVATLNRGDNPAHATFIGLNTTVTELAVAYGGRAVVGTVRPHTTVKALVNIIRSVLLLGYTAGYVLRRIVLRMPARQHHLLGSSYVKDPRLLKNLDDIADNRSDVCLVFHNQSRRNDARSVFDLTGYHTCLLTDGRFTALIAAIATGHAVRDCIKVLRYGITARSNHFRIFVRMVWYRTAYRSLFHTRQFDYFWGRDEYNADHIVRSQELRRVGGVSLGIFHGIPTSQILSPLRRHQDWDILYMAGIDFYEKHYKGTWPASMRVQAIGGFGLSHAELRNLSRPQTRDVMVFSSSTLDNDAIVRESIKLAQLLPDHTVYFKCKPGYSAAYQRFVSGDPPPPPNLKFSSSDLSITYEFLKAGGYIVASHSTIAAEGIHCGVPTFVHDNQPPEFPFHYREFARLCFTDAAEVARRIRAIEAGEEDYPWNLYSGLVDLSNRYPMSIVREDMGLPPKPGEDICDALVQRRRPRVNTGSCLRKAVNDDRG